VTGIVANVFIHHEPVDSAVVESGLEDEISDVEEMEVQQKIIYKIGEAQRYILLCLGFNFILCIICIFMYFSCYCCLLLSRSFLWSAQIILVQGSRSVNVSSWIKLFDRPDALCGNSSIALI